jgi:hypothetical protein
MMNTYIYDKPRVNERLYMGFQVSAEEQKRRAIETSREFDKAFGQEKRKEGDRKGNDGKKEHEGSKK